MENMNWLAIVAGALVPMVLGMIWYSKALFGKAWMASIGKTEEDLKKSNMPVVMGIAFILAAVLAFQMLTYMGYHDPVEQTFTHGAFHGMLLSLMTAIPVLISNSLFEQKGATNILINASYWVIALSLIGGVVTLFMG